jgi:putative transposase
LLEYERLKGIDRSWLPLDGATTKAPSGRHDKTGPNPTDRGKQRVKRSPMTEADGIPLAVVVEGANRHHMKRVRSTWRRTSPKSARCCWLKPR